MNAFLKATVLSNERYKCKKLLPITGELISHFRFSRGDAYYVRSDWRHLAGALDRFGGSTLQQPFHVLADNEMFGGRTAGRAGARAHATKLWMRLSQHKEQFS